MPRACASAQCHGSRLRTHGGSRRHLVRDRGQRVDVARRGRGARREAASGAVAERTDELPRRRQCRFPGRARATQRDPESVNRAPSSGSEQDVASVTSRWTMPAAWAAPSAAAASSAIRDRLGRAETGPLERRLAQRRARDVVEDQAPPSSSVARDRERRTMCGSSDRGGRGTPAEAAPGRTGPRRRAGGERLTATRRRHVDHVARQTLAEPPAPSRSSSRYRPNRTESSPWSQPRPEPSNGEWDDRAGLASRATDLAGPPAAPSRSRQPVTAPCRCRCRPRTPGSRSWPRQICLGSPGSRRCGTSSGT